MFNMSTLFKVTMVCVAVLVFVMDLALLFSNMLFETINAPGAVPVIAGIIFFLVAVGFNVLTGLGLVLAFRNRNE